MLLQLCLDSVVHQCACLLCSPPDPDVRHCVFASLSERFDTYLAQAESLRALFMALNDMKFEVRELAIMIAGRLCSINPAFILPVLRKSLIHVSCYEHLHRLPSATTASNMALNVSS